MINQEIKIKALNLVADLIDSALVGGWELSQDEEESILLDEEIRNIEKDLRKIFYLSEQKQKLEKDITQKIISNFNLKSHLASRKY